MKILTAGVDRITTKFLEHNGILVEDQTLEDAEELQDWLADGLYDAGVIDLNRTHLGIYAARGLRNNKINTPLIGISVDPEDRVWGDYRAMFLENGGDDLLHGPVNPRELVATLRATTRRFKGALCDIAEFHNDAASLKVNLTTKSISLNGVDPCLTGRELALVLVLASSPGHAISKDTLLARVYTDGVDDEPEIKIIDVFVSRIRKKMKEVHPDAAGLIGTAWGRGYLLGNELGGSSSAATRYAASADPDYLSREELQSMVSGGRRLISR